MNCKRDPYVERLAFQVEDRKRNRIEAAKKLEKKEKVLRERESKADVKWEQVQRSLSSIELKCIVVAVQFPAMTPQ